MIDPLKTKRHPRGGAWLLYCSVAGSTSTREEKKRFKTGWLLLFFGKFIFFEHAPNHARRHCAQAGDDQKGPAIKRTL